LDWDNPIPSNILDKLKAFIKPYENTEDDVIFLIKEIINTIESNLNHPFYNTGHYLYVGLSRILKSDKEASNFLLKKIGIDGIKYKAIPIPNSNINTSNIINYVVFDPKKITINPEPIGV
jgi:hypothetical protein